jgi:hypothetical protein
MKYLLAITFLSTLWLSCQKNNDDDSSDKLAGSYSGTFNRTGFGDSSKVRISLGDNQFTGQSDTEKYPAICRGSYEFNDQTISFVDSCAWTADFDWTLILNGTYNISFVDDNSIRIWRTNGAVTDEYLLSRMFR